MVQLNVRPPAYKKKADLSADWNTFRQGLNLLLRPTELKRTEYAQGDNILLIGSGVPTGRWGTSNYFSVNATGSIRGFGTFINNASGVNELIALSDQGYLAKKNGTSSTLITGQSYPSGTTVRSEQLGGKTYFVSDAVTLTQYNGNSLAIFATISPPTGLTATNFSGATGPAQWSWRVTALGANGGETTGPTNVVLPNLPQDLTRTQVIVRWSAPSAATFSGFSVYRGLAGDETFLAAVGPSQTAYIDSGEAASETILPPITNTTGGVKSKFITKFNDRLLFVDKDDPTKLLISGRYPNQTKLNWADGGGFIYIDPDSGQDITGIAVQPGSNKIVVFKEFSSYGVELTTVNIGNFVVLDPAYIPISTAIGCSNADTITTVENDVFYFGRKGLYVVGFEPNFLSIIRTNEVSARIRPYLALLGNQDYQNCNAFYINNKYILSFPDRKEMIVYDRERGAFAGIWKMPFGISHMRQYVDSSGTERWVIGSSETNQVYTFEVSVNSDNGTTITKTIRLNKESFNQWSALKIVKLFYILFRNITGTVTVNLLLEGRDGTTTTIKSFDIEGSAIAGNSGWGATLWGNELWGSTNGAPVSGSDEFYRWSQLFKSGRLIQVEIVCSAANSNFELLNVRMTAGSQGDGSLPSSARV
jgi:hypothetical protein